MSLLKYEMLQWKSFHFRCGYGTVHDVNTKELEDRMESFFLSETCKYLFLVSILVFKFFWLFMIQRLVIIESHDKN